MTILSVTAPSLSRKGVLQDTETEAGRQTYELRFSQALEGTIEAHFEFERLHPEQTGPVALPDIRVPGAEVQEGSFGITAETGIEVQQSNVTALRRVDVTDLPDSVRRRAVGESEILMGYQYAHAPWALSLDVKRHETVETLTAVVEQAWIESTVHEDGHLVTRFVMSVKNDDRQFLRVTLPAESKVWSVTADGVAIKAVSDDSGAVAIPLRKGRTSLIALTYEKREEPLGWFGGLTLSAPQTDVLVTNLQWLWRTPRDYAVYGVDTQLQEAHSGHYEPPPMTDEGAVSIPSGTRMKTHLFLLAVTDPSESPATIDMSYVTRPGDDAAIVLWGLAILFLVLSTYWRAQGRRRALLLLILGLALGGARLYLWTVEWSELLMAVIAVSVAAVAGAIKVRRGESVQ